MRLPSYSDFLDRTDIQNIQEDLFIEGMTDAEIDEYLYDMYRGERGDYEDSQYDQYKDNLKEL